MFELAQDVLLFIMAPAAWPVALLCEKRKKRKVYTLPHKATNP